jgi:predicted MFS family arabinose efflux permease
MLGATVGGIIFDTSGYVGTFLFSAAASLASGVFALFAMDDRR